MSSPGGSADLHGALDRLLDKPVSQRDLAASAEDAAATVDSLARGTVGVLLFKLGDEKLAIPAKHLRRITTHTRTSPIPHRTAGILRGLCNIRGELILCADIRRMLGLSARDSKDQPAPDPDPRRMVVIGPADASWVFEVDALIGVERIDPGALIPAPMTVEHAIGAFVSGLAEVGNTRVTVLDADRILTGFKAGIA